MSTPRKRPGIADSAGRAAFYPARVAARAWRGRIESAAEDVVSAPEIARIVDSALAGPLPEEIARSLVRHRVIERIVAELAATGELERLIEQALGSGQTLELTDRVLASDEMQLVLQNIASSPELRRALTRQSAGLAEDVVAGVRRSATRLDERIARPAQRRHPVYAGIATRAAALAVDALAAHAIFVLGSADVALIASLVGGIRPQCLAGSLIGVAWIAGCSDCQLERRCHPVLLGARQLPLAGLTPPIAHCLDDFADDFLGARALHAEMLRDVPYQP